MTTLIETTETLSFDEANEMYELGYPIDMMPGTISVCDGEWRKTTDHYVWWKNPERET